jgi:hypothetical protein
MENKKLLIGAGVVILGYLLWEKSQSQSVAKNDVIIPQSSMTQQEKTNLFNKAIQQFVGGMKPPDSVLQNLAKGREEAKSKIKELKLDAEFTSWVNARPKVDYGMYPPN